MSGDRDVRYSIVPDGAMFRLDCIVITARGKAAHPIEGHFLTIEDAARCAVNEHGAKPQHVQRPRPAR